ncbi:hypothetical protein K490DRAFT_52665 [Saccharata proteae CBS 121410]|uniref:Ubiquitin-like domain-containing protein n=1 Tax=Saccharata proteae CBS 121410 TaxID=1314787 RepID=A0A9P4LZI6_9PEZI|nr:hypothetical protein K490DRAFT_52665 [Saccharata proteae CBS 121410]
MTLKKPPRITISINAPGEPADQELLTLDLPPGLAVQDLKGFVQAETQFPAQFQQFYLNGQPLVGDTQTLEQAGIQDGEMLAMLIRRPQAPAAARGGRSSAVQQLRERMNNDQAGRIETTRQRILNEPNALYQLQNGQPELAAAIQDPARWREEWTKVERQQEEAQREHERQAQLLNENPFDVEAQAKIEELIRHSNVMDNIQSALETNPERFYQSSEFD